LVLNPFSSLRGGLCPSLSLKGFQTNCVFYETWAENSIVTSKEKQKLLKTKQTLYIKETFKINNKRSVK